MFANSRELVGKAVAPRLPLFSSAMRELEDRRRGQGDGPN
jgi:hypothetical protein